MVAHRHVHALALLAFAACGAKEEAEVSPKQAWEQAIAELRQPVAEISAYAPMLKEPEKKPYDPKRRPDSLRGAGYACDEIRHTANYARQRMKSGPGKEMNAAFVEVTRGCADAEDEEAIAKCVGAVQTFDKALEAAAAKASAAGATDKFPRIGPEAIDDAAKKAIAPLARAMGPGPAEKAYLSERPKEDVPRDQLISDCDAAYAEARAVWTDMEKAEDLLRKVAAVHMIAVEANCNRLKTTQAAYAAVEACKPDPAKPTKPDKEKEEECIQVCTNAKGIIHEGLAAAAFEPLKKLYEETCKEPE